MNMRRPNYVSHRTTVQATDRVSRMSPNLIADDDSQLNLKLTIGINITNNKYTC